MGLMIVGDISGVHVQLGLYSFICLFHSSHIPPFSLYPLLSFFPSPPQMLALIHLFTFSLLATLRFSSFIFHYLSLFLFLFFSLHHSSVLLFLYHVLLTPSLSSGPQIRSRDRQCVLHCCVTQGVEGCQYFVQSSRWSICI